MDLAAAEALFGMAGEVGAVRLQHLNVDEYTMRTTLLLRAASAALRRPLGGLLLAGAALQAQPAPGGDLTETQLAAALQADQRGHRLEATATLGTPADQCHPRAPRMAPQRWGPGPVLYGIDFDTTLDQLRRWTVACDCEVDRSQGVCKPAVLELP